MDKAKSLDRALKIMNLFTHEPHEFDLSEMARKLDMSRSTIVRIAFTLETHQMLTRSTTTRKYRLGPKIPRLARVYFSKVDLAEVSKPYLEELVAKTRETVCLDVIKDNERVCIARKESPHQLKIGISVGCHAPLHAGAPGKLLLAFMSDERLEEFLGKSRLTKFTDHTVTSKEELRSDIGNIRKQGFAISHGEHLDYVSAVSAPVRNHKGEVIASLNVIGLTARFCLEDEENIAVVREVADRLSEEL